jgi:DNA repair protein RAD59
MSSDFFDSKYNPDPLLYQQPTTATFFPDMAQFEEVAAAPPPPPPAPPLPTAWELRRIGTLQTRLAALQRTRESRAHPHSALSAHEVFGLANEVFGFNGWSTRVVDARMEECSEGEACLARYRTTVRITLRDGFALERLGVGEAHNLPRPQCYNKCKKEALTAATKHAIMGFALALDQLP